MTIKTRSQHLKVVTAPLMTTMIALIISQFTFSEIANAQETESYLLFACTKATNPLDDNSPRDVVIVQQEPSEFTAEGLLNERYGKTEGTVFSFRHYKAAIEKKGEERLNIHKIREIEQTEPYEAYVLYDGRVNFSSLGWDKIDDDGEIIRISTEIISPTYLHYAKKNDEGEWSTYGGYSCGEHGRSPFILQRPKKQASSTYDESEWYKQNGDTSTTGSAY